MTELTFGVYMFGILKIIAMALSNFILALLIAAVLAAVVVMVLFLRTRYLRLKRRARYI